MDFSKVAVKVGEVLLPHPRLDLYKWAVVACDQFTSQPEYWEKVAAVVGDAPSTLELIFPEVYLGKGNDKERIDRINVRMQQYLDSQILVPTGPGLIYVERRTAYGNLRKGLVAAVDLEAYDYHPGAVTLIRATEGTVLERIPPRVQIREQAVLELPHIMLLIDDPSARVIEPLAAKTGQFTKLYDTDLMMQGGHVTGYLINEPRILEEIGHGLSYLADPEAFNRKFGLSGAAPLLFAVGDGNHSLATAKTVWENLKKQGGINPVRHPARYALVEIVNVHDPGLRIEPIHRVVFHVDEVEFFKAMANALAPNGFELHRLERFEQIAAWLPTAGQRRPDNCQMFGFISAKGPGIIRLTQPAHNLAAGTLQEFLDRWVQDHPETQVDYIHGAAVLRELGSRPDNIGFLLPAMAKSDLFKTVIYNGVLPRKTFSMGEAEEKRYYMECRKIR